MTPVLEINDLSYSYRGQTALESVNLTVAAGDFMAVLGPNGGGKSTLLKIIAGLLKPRMGQVLVFGRSPAEARGRIGYAPQENGFEPGFPITVEQVVLTGRLGPNKRGYDAADRRAAAEALDQVGLTEMRNRTMAALSGGERRRVYLARALAGRGELLLLDEPAAGVDRHWQGRMFELFKEVNKSTTLILVSHDLTVVSSYVKSIACVNRSLHYHPTPEVTDRMLADIYHCPVELIAHGLPHRVLAEHGHHHDEADHD